MICIGFKHLGREGRTAWGPVADYAILKMVLECTKKIDLEAEMWIEVQLRDIRDCHCGVTRGSACPKYTCEQLDFVRVTPDIEKLL